MANWDLRGRAQKQAFSIDPIGVSRERTAELLSANVLTHPPTFCTTTKEKMRFLSYTCSCSTKMHRNFTLTRTHPALQQPHSGAALKASRRRRKQGLGLAVALLCLFAFSFALLTFFILAFLSLLQALPLLLLFAFLLSLLTLPSRFFRIFTFLPLSLPLLLFTFLLALLTH